MSLLRNDRNGKKRSVEVDDTYIGKYKISDAALSVIMLVTVAAALVAVVFCIFVIGTRLSNGNKHPSDSEITESGVDISDLTSDFGDGPDDSAVFQPSESASDTEFKETSTDGEPSDTVNEETSTNITTETPTDQSKETSTEEPTETETKKPSEETEGPTGYVPITPDDVSVIGYSDMSSQYAILVDCNTNTAIAQRLADRTIYPASLTKIMTVVVAYENIENFNDTFTMTKELVLKAYNQGASMACFYAHTVLTMTDLMYGTILPSGAEAAYGLAQCVAGSEEAFAVLMNKKAAELGMTNTHFVNVTGLHDPNHYSTVRDMATLMNYAMSIPAIKEIMSAVEYIRSDGQQTLRSVVFKWTDYEHKTCSNGLTMVAGKSGYTPEAQRCLASYYESESGERYILVTAYAYGSGKTPVNDAGALIEKYIK